MRAARGEEGRCRPSAAGLSPLTSAGAPAQMRPNSFQTPTFRHRGNANVSFSACGAVRRSWCSGHRFAEREEEFGGVGHSCAVLAAPPPPVLADSRTFQRSPVTSDTVMLLYCQGPPRLPLAMGRGHRAAAAGMGLSTPVLSQHMAAAGCYGAGSSLVMRSMMSAADCTGSYSANRWHRFSESVWLLATNPKILWKRRGRGAELQREPLQTAPAPIPLHPLLGPRPSHVCWEGKRPGEAFWQCCVLQRGEEEPRCCLCPGGGGRGRPGVPSGGTRLSPSPPLSSEVGAPTRPHLIPPLPSMGSALGSGSHLEDLQYFCHLKGRRTFQSQLSTATPTPPPPCAPHSLPALGVHPAEPDGSQWVVPPKEHPVGRGHSVRAGGTTGVLGSRPNTQPHSSTPALLEHR